VLAVFQVKPYENNLKKKETPNNPADFSEGCLGHIFD
jgi:hypothetical protein